MTLDINNFLRNWNHTSLMSLDAPTPKFLVASFCNSASNSDRILASVQCAHESKLKIENHNTNTSQYETVYTIDTHDEQARYIGRPISDVRE